MPPARERRPGLQNPNNCGLEAHNSATFVGLNGRRPMKPFKRDRKYDASQSDLGAVALVGLMFGFIVVAAGVAQQQPVLKGIAEAYGVSPALAPAETIFLGLGLIFAASGLFALTLRSKARRR
jgi:hypothetical protein